MDLCTNMFNGTLFVITTLPPMYGYESWTIKKAERQRIDAFEPWCWRRVFWTVRRPNSPEGNQP